MHLAGWGLNTVLSMLDKLSLPLSYILSPYFLLLGDVSRMVCREGPATAQGRLCGHVVLLF